MKTLSEQLAASEAIRKELAYAVGDLLDKPTPRVLSRAARALGHNETLDHMVESELPLSPGDAAASEEHAANFDPTILAERIDAHIEEIDVLIKAVHNIEEQYEDLQQLAIEYVKANDRRCGIHDARMADEIIATVESTHRALSAHLIAHW